MHLKSYTQKLQYIVLQNTIKVWYILIHKATLTTVIRSNVRSNKKYSQKCHVLKILKIFVSDSWVSESFTKSNTLKLIIIKIKYIKSCEIQI